MAAIARSPFADRLEQSRVPRQPGNVLIHDYTPVGRTGFKGAGTTDWLASKVSTLPERPNRAVTLSDGTVIGRLGKEEYLVLNGRNSMSDICGELDASWASESAGGGARMGYPLPRADSHSWLFIKGARVSEMMSKICGVDLRDKSFPPGEIAQTIVARIGAVLIRETGASEGLHLLTDFASADYLWEVLDDASAEYGGGFVPAGRK
ncbi:sarcosine oxidase subunit gamma [Sinorhizobium kostiense]|uniref:Sarcosine oxidase subunit gamma n=1 Tax=Sinorhizobium kostiense TaxID=76747 RepID=A0ABS4R8M1_9HYPH|nr:sarcosine oxidase subunit gamma family protein [Sinorhizobium kostiense]MBP2239044.1 sarcosine oxidase subunit gamma [Sinorhizobium kostiense]